MYTNRTAVQQGKKETKKKNGNTERTDYLPN